MEAGLLREVVVVLVLDLPEAKKPLGPLGLLLAPRGGLGLVHIHHGAHTIPFPSIARHACCSHAKLWLSRKLESQSFDYV